MYLLYLQTTSEVSAMSFDAFPEELRSKAQYVVWKPVPEKDGKIKKVP
jgi:primase-polymerase (primpol)-like protein